MQASRPTLGIIGFGAFGRLMARDLRGIFALRVYDPLPGRDDEVVPEDISRTTLAAAAACPVVVLAAPVDTLADLVAAIAPHVAPGALVLDVGSVKCGPAAIMAAGLPAGVDIVATHPLFGPQSAQHGLAGLKIALCPVRGSRTMRVAAFLRRALGLTVIVTTPEAHDREAAVVQGLTHLIARTLVAMEPLPSRMTTRSFDLIVEAVGLVRHDAPAVGAAIAGANPYAQAARQRFLALASALYENGAP